MADRCVGISPEDFRSLTIDTYKSTLEHGRHLLSMTERLGGIDKRLDGLAQGQLRLVADQQQLIQDSRDRDLRMGKLRNEMRERIDRLEHEMRTGFEAVDKRFQTVEGRLDGMDRRFVAIDKRFDGVDERFDLVHGQLTGMQTQMNGMQRQLNVIAEAVGAASPSAGDG